MTPAAAPSSRLVVRLEADAGPAMSGEVRLLEPLDVTGAAANAAELPAIDADLAGAAIESIFDLQRGLADSNADRAWWYLPVAEWQPNMSVLPATVELAARLETLGRKAHGRFALTVPNPVAAGYLMDRFAVHRDIAIVADASARRSWALRRAKAVMLRLLNAAAWLVENVGYVRGVNKVRPAPQIPGRIDTLFVSRIEAGFVPPADGVWNDAYLGTLPAEGHKRTGAVALVLRNGGAPAEQARSVAAFRRFPVGLVFEYLSLLDVVSSLLRALRFRLGIDTVRNPLARAALAESHGHVRALADWFIVERAMRNVLRAVKPRQIVCMQENSNWEFAVAMAAESANPRPRTFGFFHCPVMPSAQRYRTRADVLTRRPNFDRTVTLGSTMRRALSRLGDWEPVLSSLHYAFRNPDISKCLALPVRVPGTTVRLLAVLGGAFDNGRFLAWLKSATEGIAHLTVVIKPHPSFDHRPALAAAGIDLSGGRFVLSPHRGMDLALSEADILVYKGTTVCFAALAAGVPAVHINHGGVASDDTLFDADDLAISVGDPSAFAAAVLRLRTQTLDARQAWAARARDYVRQYYDLSEESREQALTQLFPALSSAPASAVAG